MKLSALIKANEFKVYFVIGGIATLIDWFVFWLLMSQCGLHYQMSLMGSFILATLFHYAANKMFTFGCQSKKIGSQFSLYLLVAISSLALSMGVMSIIVNVFALNKLYARVLTTMVILLPNYLLHKFISFNKKIFLQPETS